MNENTYGSISLDNGYRFIWMASYGDGEIHGSVERPSGGFVNGLSGWYRTSSPETAAKVAQNRVRELQVK